MPEAGDADDTIVQTMRRATDGAAVGHSDIKRYPDVHQCCALNCAELIQRVDDLEQYVKELEMKIYAFPPAKANCRCLPTRQPRRSRFIFRPTTPTPMTLSDA